MHSSELNASRYGRWSESFVHKLASRRLYVCASDSNISRSAYHLRRGSHKGHANYALAPAAYTPTKAARIATNFPSVSEGPIRFDRGSIKATSSVVSDDRQVLLLWDLDNLNPRGGLTGITLWSAKLQESVSTLGSSVSEFVVFANPTTRRTFPGLTDWIQKEGGRLEAASADFQSADLMMVAAGVDFAKRLGRGGRLAVASNDTGFAQLLSWATTTGCETVSIGTWHIGLTTPRQPLGWTRHSLAESANACVLLGGMSREPSVTPSRGKKQWLCLSTSDTDATLDCQISQTSQTGQTSGRALKAAASASSATSTMTHQHRQLCCLSVSQSDSQSDSQSTAEAPGKHWHPQEAVRDIILRSNDPGWIGPGSNDQLSDGRMLESEWIAQRQETEGNESSDSSELSCALTETNATSTNYVRLSDSSGDDSMMPDAAPTKNAGDMSPHSISQCDIPRQSTSASAADRIRIEAHDPRQSASQSQRIPSSLHHVRSQTEFGGRTLRIKGTAYPVGKKAVWQAEHGPRVTLDHREDLTLRWSVWRHVNTR